MLGAVAGPAQGDEAIENLWDAYLCYEEGIVPVGDFQALEMPKPCRNQLGEDFEGQRHVLACHVEVHHDPGVAGLRGSHVNVQQLEGCTRDVLQCSKRFSMLESTSWPAGSITRVLLQTQC